MPLITYAQARPWATAMKEVVLARTMPPWGAVKGFRPLQNDPTLSQDEIDRIAQWVEGGAPEGDPKFLPAAPAVNAPADVPYRRVSLAELPADLTLIGLAPESDAADARITAELPDGRILPLLWLHGYKGQWRRAFRFVDPVVLPRGTRIRCSPSIRIEGLIAAPKPGC